MSEQPVDLYFARVALRRHRKLIAALFLAGCVIGAALAVVRPAPHTSSSLVLLQASGDSQGSAASVGITTQAEIVRSQPVLTQALSLVGSDLTVRELHDAVSVSTPTDSLLELEVRAATAADAVRLSAAIAQAYEAYTNLAADPLSQEALTQLKEQADGLEERLQQVQDELTRTRERLASAPAGSAEATKDAQLVALLVGQEGDLAVQLSMIQQTLSLGNQAPADSGVVSATVIQSGTAATRPSPIGHAALWVGACGLAGAALGALTALVRTRRDPRLHALTDLSRALGAPVLAGIAGRPQRRAEDWPELLRTYEPPAVDAWAVRLLLREILGVERGIRAAAGSDRAKSSTGPTTVILMSLVGDSAGLALGPQIAAIAASLDVRTALLIAGSGEFAGGLSAGLALARSADHVRTNLSLARSMSEARGLELAFVLVALDPAEPDLSALPAAQEHLLCVGAGEATAEDLARLALVADSAGRRITGAVVANPESWDQPSSSKLGLPVVVPTRSSAVTPLPRSSSDGAKPPAQRARRRR